MVWKEVKKVQTEKFESRGRVFNAEEIFEKADKNRERNGRDFGQVDITDHQVEQAEEIARKQNNAIWKVYGKGFRKS